MGLPNEKGYPHKGQLDFASISLTPTTGTLLLRGVFPNPGGKILPGLYARVRVPGQGRTRPPGAPGGVWDTNQRGFYVLVVDEKNMVQRVGVKTGVLLDHLRVVEEGLTGKEWVVIKGVQKAIPGRVVSPERVDLGTSANSSSPSPGQRKAGS